MNQTAPPDLHLLAAEHRTLLLDVDNQRLYELHDPLVIDVLRGLGEARSAQVAAGQATTVQAGLEEVVDKLGSRYDREAVVEVLQGLIEQGVLDPSTRAIPEHFRASLPGEPIRALALVCLEAAPAPGWAQQAIDFALSVAPSTDPLHVIFPAPSMPQRWAAIEAALAYRETLEGPRPIEFIVDVDAAGLTDGMLETLQSHRVALRATVDASTPHCLQDSALRRLIQRTQGRLALRLLWSQEDLGCWGVHHKIPNEFLDMGIKLVYVEGTAGDGLALFSQVDGQDQANGHLLRFADLVPLMAACHLGGYRAYGCLAGRGYVAITSSGDVYPCHRFAGVEAFKLGNLREGIGITQQARFCANHVNNRAACLECWARYYCGGGCAHLNWQESNDIGVAPPNFCQAARSQVSWALAAYSTAASEQKIALEFGAAIADRHKPYLAFDFPAG